MPYHEGGGIVKFFGIGFLVFVVLVLFYKWYSAKETTPVDGKGDAKLNGVATDEKTGTTTPVSCDVGFVLKDGKCVEVKMPDVITETPITGNGTGVVDGTVIDIDTGVVVPVQCELGFRLENGVCVAIQCPDGQQLDGTTCTAMDCGPGLELVGNNCLIPCEPGFRREGNECIFIPCPDGYIRTEDGKSCELLPCPAGYNRDDGGEICKKDLPPFGKAWTDGNLSCLDGYTPEYNKWCKSTCLPSQNYVDGSCVNKCLDTQSYNNGVCEDNVDPNSFTEYPSSGLTWKINANGGAGLTIDQCKKKCIDSGKCYALIHSPDECWFYHNDGTAERGGAISMPGRNTNVYMRKKYY